MSAEEARYDSTTCSACGAYLKPQEIVCIECGVNQRTSYKIPSAQKSNAGLTSTLRMALGIGLAIIAMNVITLNRDLRGYAQEAADTEDLFATPPAPTATVDANPLPASRQPATSRSTDPLPSTTSRVTPLPTTRVPRKPTPTSPPAALTPPTTESGKEFGLAPAPAPSPAPPEPEPAVAAEPEPAPINITVLKQQIQTEIAEDMNRTLPMMTAGRIQTLETKTGTKSGMVNLIGPDYLLVTVRGTPTRIPFAELETKSRIRADAAFRAKMIEDMTYRKLANSRPDTP